MGVNVNEILSADLDELSGFFHLKNKNFIVFLAYIIYIRWNIYM